jgi:signal transduction histidine kinase
VSPEDRTGYRQEALGAFAHEFRTPLTAIKMVMELGRRAGGEGKIVLDPEIAEMFDESMAGLEELADGIQALSWLERGKLALSDGPCELSDAIAGVRRLLGEDVAFEVAGAEKISGPWDPEKLRDCLAALIDAAVRCGDGAPVLRAEQGSGTTLLVVESGKPGGEARPINADLGFRFFAACLTLEQFDGSVVCERRAGYLRVEIELPS